MHNRFIIVCFLLILSLQGAAQSYIGIHGGFSASKTSFGDPTYKDNYRDRPKLGYHLGVDAQFKATGKFSLYVAPGYAKRGVSIKSLDEMQVKNRLTYSYLETPILLQYSLFRSPYTPIFEFGPRISYWLGGKGKVRSLEMEQPFDLPYRLRFKEMDGYEQLHVEGSARVQFGLIFGAGWSYDFRNGQKVMVIARYELGGTYHSSLDRNPFRYLSYYEHSFRHKNNTLSVTASWLMNVENVRKRLTK